MPRQHATSNPRNLPVEWREQSWCPLVRASSGGMMSPAGGYIRLVEFHLNDFRGVFADPVTSHKRPETHELKSS